MYDSKNRIKAARDHQKRVEETMRRRMLDSYDPVLKSIYEIKTKDNKNKEQTK